MLRNESKSWAYNKMRLQDMVEDTLINHKRYVLKIKQFDEVEENIAQNTFGTIIHTILENLFKPYLDIYLNIEIIDEILHRGPDISWNCKNLNKII